jgi:hypothetical protein
MDELGAPDASDVKIGVIRTLREYGGFVLLAERMLQAVNGQSFALTPSAFLQLVSYLCREASEQDCTFTGGRA